MRPQLPAPLLTLRPAAAASMLLLFHHH
eukprot:COSAG06_NODE_71078_length_188_cov_15.460674_1_plen_27_part_10